MCGNCALTATSSADRVPVPGLGFKDFGSCLSIGVEGSCLFSTSQKCEGKRVHLFPVGEYEAEHQQLKPASVLFYHVLPGQNFPQNARVDGFVPQTQQVNLMIASYRGRGRTCFPSENMKRRTTSWNLLCGVGFWGLWFKGLGFRVYGLGLRVEG